MTRTETRLLNVVSELAYTRAYPVSPERDSYLRKLNRELTRVMRAALRTPRKDR
jgi:hypothetical protein